MVIPHPGRSLLLQFLQPAGISQNALGRALGVPPRRINEIIHGKRAISADSALRLGRYFGNGAQYWMRLQADYEIELARRKIGNQIERIVPLTAHTADHTAPSAAAVPPEAAATKRNIKRRLMR